jgi:pimeloyl-ACP methyl ester carboxylesterase
MKDKEDKTMASIDINGTTLEYFEEGEGESVVLVHGSASDYRTWQFQRHEFANSFRVIVYSRRYHWPNDRILEGQNYTMAEHVGGLESILHSLDAEPAHLVGNSYGAFLCLLLAIKKPNLARTLVLAEPPIVSMFVSTPPKPLEILRLLISRPRTALSIIKFGAMGVNPAIKAAKQGNMEESTRIFGEEVLGKEAYSQLSESRLEQARINTIKEEFAGSGFAPFDSDQIRNIQIPVLLINGKQSPPLFHHLIDALEELLPNSKRVEISDASHIAHAVNHLPITRQFSHF